MKHSHWFGITALLCSDEMEHQKVSLKKVGTYKNEMKLCKLPFVTEYESLYQVSPIFTLGNAQAKIFEVKYK